MTASGAEVQVGVIDRLSVRPLHSKELRGFYNRSMKMYPQKPSDKKQDISVTIRDRAVAMLNCPPEYSACKVTHLVGEQKIASRCHFSHVG